MKRKKLKVGEKERRVMVLRPCFAGALDPKYLNNIKGFAKAMQAQHEVMGYGLWASRRQCKLSMKLWVMVLRPCFAGALDPKYLNNMGDG
jgi:hypothetical protein